MQGIVLTDLIGMATKDSPKSLNPKTFKTNFEVLLGRLIGENEESASVLEDNYSLRNLTKLTNLIEEVHQIIANKELTEIKSTKLMNLLQEVETLIQAIEGEIVGLPKDATINLHSEVAFSPSGAISLEAKVADSADETINVKQGTVVPQEGTSISEKEQHEQLLKLINHINFLLQDIKESLRGNSVEGEFSETSSRAVEQLGEQIIKNYWGNKETEPASPKGTLRESQPEEKSEQELSGKKANQVNIELLPKERFTVRNYHGRFSSANETEPNDIDKTIISVEKKLTSLLDKLRILVQQEKVAAANERVSSGDKTVQTILPGEVLINSKDIEKSINARRGKLELSLDKATNVQGNIEATINHFFSKQQDFKEGNREQVTPELRIQAVNLPLNGEFEAAKEAKATTVLRGQHNYPQVSDQIIKHVKLMLSEGKSQITFQLEPKELGRLSLRVTMEQGILMAKFSAANLQVKSLLESNMAQLRQSLEELGVKESKLEVGVGQQFLGENFQNQSRQWFNNKSSKHLTVKAGYEEIDFSENKPLLRQHSSFEYVV